jgi:predicted permease
MIPGSNRPVAISLRLYRALASAFPYEFKNAYGTELVQVTEDAIEPIWRHYGLLGLVRLLADIALRVPAEHLAELWQDIRYGLRMLARSPGFTAVALISLSLGICVGTAAFSELNATVLRNLPGVPKPEELVALQVPASYPNYQRYSAKNDLFTSAFAYVAPVPFGVSLGGGTERTWGHLVTPEYFSTLGVRPEMGRFFDDRPPGLSHFDAPAVVISHRFWEGRLGSDPMAIGKTLRINGHACTVIGVAPREFLGASPMIFAADIWMPVTVEGRVVPELADNALERRNLTMFHVAGRLKPGITPARAEAELDTVARQLEQAFGDADRERPGRRVQLVPGGKILPIRSQDLPMMTAFPIVLVGLVLLIACSNVANMMLARAARRRREIAVRLALGASRARLVRQLLTESMLVALAAGALGFLLAAWLMRLASQIKTPYPMPMTYNLEPDGTVLLFTLGLTIFTGLAFGLAPALQATRADLTPALKEGGAVRLRTYRRFSLRNLLVLYQVAGSLMLLLVTGFLVRSFQRTNELELGFNPSHLYLISLDPMREGYSGEQARVFLQKLRDRVQSLSSVTAASLTDTVPLGMNGNGVVTFSTAGTGAGAANSRVIHSARKYIVGKDYFETLSIPILAGRGFRKEDEANDAPAVIVSQKLVQEFWKGEDPLGRRIEVGAGEEAPLEKLDYVGSFDHRPMASGQARQEFQVVGVAKDAKMEFALVEAPPGIYFPMRAADYGRPSLLGVTLLVRAAPGVDAAGAVRREIRAMDANLAPFNARSMADQIEQIMYLVRMGVWIYGFIGVFGLILASVGLAGVTAYSVTQRAHEIGIRIALGAQSNDVLRLVMKEGVVLVAVGTGIGLAGAWAVARLLSSILEVVAKVTSASTFDPVLIVGAPLLLASLALVACYLPARKSMQIDAAVALRQD